MEHIGKVLQNLDREKPIPDLKTTDWGPEKFTVEERREELRRNLGVVSLDNTFENFKPVKGTEKSLAAFKALALGKTDKPLLLCYGGVGNGKTHLCDAASIALYKRGLFCRVLTMDRMMSALKGCMDPQPSISYEELLNNYSHADRLIIDDVEGTEWAFGELEKIIRVRDHEHLFTIMTTNLDIKFDPRYPNLPFIPERIVSRFSDPNVGMVVLNSGEDFRRLKAKG